ncbi:hypothetical protein [Spirosoma pomorum]
MKNLQEELSLLERFKAPTPGLFKTIRNGGIVLASLAAAVLGLEAKGVIVPDSIEMVASLIVTVTGTIAALVAQLTVNLPEYEIKKALGQ